ncbi:hypothetical protein VF21_03595 [Pseudogymnoascus sp. 05NY08]|nr:hypothetical protein VF21_03595 [Pseudogymnoascus sp. 05NY08]
MCGTQSVGWTPVIDELGSADRTSVLRLVTPKPSASPQKFPNNYMAPSRGITALLRANCSATSALRYGLQRRHGLTRSYTSIPNLATNPARQTQIYISRSTDPYLNLSLEHYLLQSTPPTSTVLFLYTNRPSLIVGRNQNPWVETNLSLLRNPPSSASTDDISLVRRRSGGGAVFHDEGNVNYCVITPTSEFDRDKHAHMVVRALHSLGATRAAVNARHDIVLDVSPPPIPRGKKSNITTCAAATGPATPTHRKVSGSAYKLTRLRSLHHGTCLLSSPNIGGIGAYLRSPGKGYMLARGVDSVSSPIANVRVGHGEFEGAVVREFEEMYGGVEIVEVGEEEIEGVEEIRKGVKELKSEDWIYLQTPQFTFSSHPTEEDPRERPLRPSYVPAAASVLFTARNGAITEAEIRNGEGERAEGLVGRKVHEILDWRGVLGGRDDGVGRWLNGLFGV